ncbi:MAG TPA: hypothetical protein VM900_14795 [Sphingomonas sp.]|nr:hypothetical protein [Sphingomonas sp.]
MPGTMRPRRGRPTLSQALVLVAVLLAACGQQQPAAVPDTPGARLERAARAAGLVPDPQRGTLVGSWSRDADRLCIVPGDRGAYRVGAIVDYGEGQSCIASGTAKRSGAALDIRFGACRVQAGYDGSRIVFPAELSADCAATCAGRASFAALTVDRVSESVAEASTLRSPAGKLLCAG